MKIEDYRAKKTQIGVSKPLTPHSHLMIQEYLTETERTINFASENNKRKPNRFEGCRHHFKISTLCFGFC